MNIPLIGVFLAIVGLSCPSAFAAPLAFPQGTATPSETCGECHRAIYNEFAHGFGADILYRDITLKSAAENKLNLPAGVSNSATAHAFAGVDPFPAHARDIEEEGRSCNVCHYPEAFAIPDMNVPELAKPKARPKTREQGGLTCASCHLTPEGKIRAAHEVKAPHETVADPAIQTSAMCAYCHSVGKRVVSKQTQTFLEWRDDFFKKGLGRQQCQDCHMRPTGRIANVAAGHGGARRDPRTLHNHLFFDGSGGDMLRRCLRLDARAARRGDAVRKLGIRLPGGSRSPLGDQGLIPVF